VSELPFTTTSRRLTAVTVIGAGVGWVALVAVPLLVLPMPAMPAALVVLSALMLLGLLAMGLSKGWLPLAAPAIPCANIEARRGTPQRWLVAHYDSKEQTLSLAVRVIAAVCAAAGGALLAALGIARVLGPVPWPIAVVASAAAVVGGALLSRGSLANGSPGAVDNASGVIAALTAAEILRSATDIGVLITDAEELGMEGARAWLAHEQPLTEFINFDGLDDRGVVRLTVHGRDGRRLATSLANCLRASGYPVSRRPLPFAIPVDGAILGGRSVPGVTVSRGDFTTAKVIHTPGDAVERLNLDTAMSVGKAAAAVFSRPVG